MLTNKASKLLNSRVEAVMEPFCLKDNTVHYNKMTKTSGHYKQMKNFMAAKMLMHMIQSF